MAKGNCPLMANQIQASSRSHGQSMESIVHRARSHKYVCPGFMEAAGQTPFPTSVGRAAVILPHLRTCCSKGDFITKKSFSRTKHHHQISTQGASQCRDPVSDLNNSIALITSSGIQGHFSRRGIWLPSRNYPA